MFKKMKRDPADDAFSKAVRIRDKWTCQKCERVFLEHERRNLDCSHFWGRGKENTRFDPENADALCGFYTSGRCHSKWEKEERKDYEAFKINQLGQEGFDLLEFRKNVYKKKDRKMRFVEMKEYLRLIEEEKKDGDSNV